MATSFSENQPLAIEIEDEKWKVGTFAGNSADNQVTLRFADGTTKTFSANDVKGADDIYLDYRGEAMSPMSFSEAFEIVHELAAQQQPDKDDPDLQDDSPQGVIAWQQKALDAFEDLVTNHSERIDDAFKTPLAAGEYSDAVVGCDFDLDPDTDVVAAMRICLELGENGIEDRRKADPEMYDSIDRANQACDLVRDFIGLHGSDLSRKITIVRSPV